MTKEELRTYLGNDLLMQAIRARANVNQMTNKLQRAGIVMEQVGMSEEVKSETCEKFKELSRIEQAYKFMIEEAWNLGWQEQHIINEYMDKSEAELDRLPQQLEA